MPKVLKTCLRPGCGKQCFAANMEPVHQYCDKCVAKIVADLLPVPDVLDGERDGECEARECRWLDAHKAKAAENELVEI